MNKPHLFPLRVGGIGIMTNTQQQADRRKQKRFSVHRDAFVAVGPHFDKVGPIIDVSMGGLAFHYLAIGKQKDGLSADIFLTNRDFFVGYVPFDIIGDFEVPNTQPSGIATIRRCNLRFRDLTQSHISKLRYFIETCIDSETGHTPGLYAVEREKEKDDSYNCTSKGNQGVAGEK
jgi:hypothetical protein